MEVCQSCLPTKESHNGHLALLKSNAPTFLGGGVLGTMPRTGSGLTAAGGTDDDDADDETDDPAGKAKELADNLRGVVSAFGPPASIFV